MMDSREATINSNHTASASPYAVNLVATENYNKRMTRYLCPVVYIEDKVRNGEARLLEKSKIHPYSKVTKLINEKTKYSDNLSLLNVYRGKNY